MLLTTRSVRMRKAGMPRRLARASRHALSKEMSLREEVFSETAGTRLVEDVRRFLPPTGKGFFIRRPAVLRFGLLTEVI